MHKNGVHPTTKRTRWRCRICGASTIRRRTDKSSAVLFQLFITWISKKASLNELAAASGVSRSTLARKFQMFWFVTPPRPLQTGEIYDQVMIDGTYFGRSDCLLIARNSEHVLAWQWCKRENKLNYQRLLGRIVPPVMVITDGNYGALRALETDMPEVVIQRCLFHIRSRVTQLVTLRPRTQAGRDLQKLARYLLHITTIEQAQAWEIEFRRAYHKHAKWLNERTYRNQVRREEVPRYVRSDQRWWFTHKNTRDAYNSVMTPLKRGHLFKYLLFDRQDSQAAAASTTNSVESLNSLIKLFNRLHRGRTPEHRRRAAEWLLYLRTEGCEDPVVIAARQNYGKDAYERARALGKQEAKKTEQKLTVQHFQDEAMFEEGIWVRKGWAGR